MTLDKDDQKVITEIIQKTVDSSVEKAIDASVKPEFVIINRKLDATMEMTAKNTEDIGGIKKTLADHDKKFEKIDERFDAIDKKFDEADERFDDVDASLNRVETLAKSEIKYVDKLSDRVLVLEKASK